MSQKPFLQVLAGQRVDPPPIWLMRQAGRYLPEYRKVRATAGSFLDLCLSPAFATEVTLQPIRRYGFDASILFSDILVIPYALGQALDYLEGEGPRLGPLPALDDLGRDMERNILGRLAPVLETVANLSAALPAPTALIGFAGAPWTVACYMLTGGGDRDWTAARIAAYRNPALVDGLLALLVDASEIYLSAQIQAGAEVIQLFESWAGILPGGVFDRLVIGPTRELVRRLKARHPSVPIIGFPRGCGALAVDYAAGTGIDAIGLDWTVPGAWAAEHLQSRMPVQGNLDPAVLIAGGAAMAESTRAVLAAFAGGPHIFNLGHGVVPSTPPEHVEELVGLIRSGR